MYTDDDEIGRAVAADLEECWQGEGWYRICFTDGMGSYGMEPKRTLPTTFAVPTGMPARSICPTPKSL